MYATHTNALRIRRPIDWSRFLPFLRWRNRVTGSNTKDNAIAGLTGALIVLPQAVAFATIAGLPPEYGCTLRHDARYRRGPVWFFLAFGVRSDNCDIDCRICISQPNRHTGVT